MIYFLTRRHLPRFAQLYPYLQHHDARAFRGFKAFLYFKKKFKLCTEKNYKKTVYRYRDKRHLLTIY